MNDNNETTHQDVLLPDPLLDWPGYLSGLDDAFAILRNRVAQDRMRWLSEEHEIVIAPFTFGIREVRN